MQAASELIVEVGFEAMTTAEVARRAGVAEGTIYTHFAGKAALAEAVFADIWRIFNDYMEQHLPPRERPRERLEAFFKTTLEGIDALMPTYGSLGQQDYLHYVAKRRSLEPLPAGADRYVAMLEEAILLAQRTRVVRPGVDARIAAHFLFFGGGQAMDFFGDPHHLVKGAGRLPQAILSQLEDLMTHALYGTRE